MNHLSLFCLLLFLVACKKTPNNSNHISEIPNTNSVSYETDIHKRYPRLWVEIALIKKDGVTIEYDPNLKNPGQGRGKNKLAISPSILSNTNLNENDLMIILWHEYGHVLDARTDPDRSQLSNFDRNTLAEHIAFRYSVEVAINYAKSKKDFGPLAEVITNLEAREKNGSLNDPHTIAIKQLLQEPFWQTAKEQVKNK